MTIVVDTSVLVAAVNRKDPRHPQAIALLREILAGEHGRPVSSEYVLDEGLTLLRRRCGREEVSEAFASYLLGDDVEPPPVRLVTTVWEDLVFAYQTHLRLYESRLSFTDCVLVGLAESLKAPVASFDGGFDGIVQRVSEA